MEEDKKKKRNKKNKNKQIKTPDPDEDLDPTNNNDATISQNINITQLQLDLRPNGALPSSAEEMVKELQKERESHVQKKATLQETIQHLKMENESYIQKQGTLEETINQLRNECDSHLKKEASLEESIMKLQQINDSHLQKEDSLKETILQLQSENESHIQKMAASEMDIIRLHNEKELWLQEKATLEAKIHQLLEEKAALDLKGANLEENIEALEKEKESWILTENSTKETISILNRDITRLKMQVVELEESRSKLLQENQQLTNTASSLQLHIRNLEKNVTPRPSSSSDEVEKVNELSVKLKRQTMAAGYSMVNEMSDPGTHSIENGSLLSPKLDSLEVTQTNERKIVGVNEDGQPAAQVPLSVESEDVGVGMGMLESHIPHCLGNQAREEDTGEIVQIPLDDTNARGSQLQAIEIESNTVPLTDAPLIGAPFRLISFVANYVTGADLVNDTSSLES